jgi:hypothetical protein
VTLTIPIPEKVSLNRIYSGVHFSERSRHKSDYHFAVLAGKPIPYDGPFPVHCHYHFRLHGTPLDISNHAYMQKMVEDGLVGAGILPGDDPKYVGSITITSEKDDADEVDVTITPCAQFAS